MNALESAIATVLDRLVSKIGTLGYFDTVQLHEPASAPRGGPTGLTCAVFLARLGPAVAASPLDATSARVEMTIRIFKLLQSEPRDLIDVNLAMAVAAVMGALAADFDLGDSVRNVDLRGAHGQPLGGQAGYQIIDGARFRIFDIATPLIIDDAFPQSA